MRLALTFAFVLAAATGGRSGCGSGGGHAYDPCAGKACGDACHLCDPADPTCGETALAKACDPFGRCVGLADGMCAFAGGACTGKSCGDDCVIDPPCRSATPPCMLPSVLGHCANDTECVAGPPPPCPPGPPVTSCAGVSCGTRCLMPCTGTGCTPAQGWCGGDQCLPVAPPCPAPPPPSWGCVGKTCGDGCGYCPPGADPATCPVPTLAATACDPALQCATAGTFTCPADPCAGKACGAPCDPCGGMCMHAYASACDAAGRCLPVPVTCGP